MHGFLTSLLLGEAGYSQPLELVESSEGLAADQLHSVVLKKPKSSTEPAAARHHQCLLI